MLNVKSVANYWQTQAVSTDTGRSTLERSLTSVPTVTSKSSSDITSRLGLILPISRRFIQRYNMKQHIKTHRLDPEEMAKNSINIDLTPKPESLNPLKLALPSFLPDSGLNLTH